MEWDSPGGPPERMARQQARISGQLRDSGLLVFALAGPAAPGTARFAGAEQAGDGRLTAVRLVHDGGRPDGPWAGVQSVRGSGPAAAIEWMRRELEAGIAAYGDRVGPQAWTSSGLTVMAEGIAASGHLLRAGSRWWGAYCTRLDTEITVLARDWRPPLLEVGLVADLAPVLAGLWAAPAAGAAEPGHRGEPHRALAEVCLRLAADRALRWWEWGFAPQLPSDWGELWRATVRRQADLAGQPEAAAEAAVVAMLAQLGALQSEAAWFRDDARLRERAIAETLLFCTGLSATVSSAAAQRAWPVRDAALRDMNRPAEARATAGSGWLAAWAAWAAALS